MRGAVACTVRSADAVCAGGWSSGLEVRGAVTDGERAALAVVRIASSLGLPVRTISNVLIILVAVAAVAAFDAVGSILVIAMFICPAATARMLTDNLARQLWLSVVVGTLAGIGGYILAAFGPQTFGSQKALSAAGMIAVVAGLLQLFAMIAAPRYGILTRFIRYGRNKNTPNLP